MQKTRESVIKWLESGADAQEGVQLLKRACAPSLFVRLVSSSPIDFRRAIISWLDRYFKLQGKFLNNAGAALVVYKPKAISFREEFPFLNEPSCPIELETLASRKFARYHAYVALHAELRGAGSLEECASISRSLIESYLENRLIWDELNYYKTQGMLLGRHPIFAELARRKELLAMPMKELMIRKGQVEHTIWRIASEIKKGDKPHLAAERAARLEGYKVELHEIKRLIG